MRANVNLDTEAYTFATTYANARGLPLGRAISELLRRAEQAPPLPSPLLRRNRHGMLVKAKNGRVVTSEMAKKLAEDDRY